MSRQDRPDDPSTEELTPPTRGPDDSSPTFVPADLPPHADSVAIPGYEVLGQLGQGGMGTVYRARHRALDRVVALKLLGDGIRADPARFRTEVEAIARLQHPNIVQIFEVGVWGGSDGHPSLPYFTMEFCAGGSLDHRLAGTPLPGRDAAGLAETLARAMQAAHDARIIHRDLKPANVLLQKRLNHPDTETQRRRENEIEDNSFPSSLLCASVSGWFNSYSPKISDFGLAKKLDEVGQTQTGAVMGTPSYMAPEQARGNKDVGPGVDVYALGAILYECVTGRPPFKAATTFDTLQQVVADEPAPPRRLNPKVDRDLETICLKCLEKDPRLRLPSAGVLADELRRYLDGKPILSRPIGVIGRFWRWGKRNPVVAGAGGLAVLALLGVLFVSIVFALREHRHSNELREALFTARRQVAENHLDRALVSSAQTEPDERLLWLARSLQAAPDEAANLQRVIRLNLSAWSRALHELRAPLPHEAVVRCLAFSSDGKLLLTGCENGAVQIWDTHRCEPAGPPRTLGSAVLAVAFDEQGRALATVRGEENVRIVDARSGKTLAGPFAHEDRVVAAGWSGDGKLLATGSGDGKARVWDVSLNKARTDPLPHDHAVIAVALSPDGQQLLAGTLGRKAQLWDVGTGKPRGAALEHPQQVSAVAFVPGGERIVTGCGDNTVRMWDAKTGKAHGNPIRHRPADGTLWGLAVSADGERLLSAGDDGTARMWRLSAAERVGQAMAHHDGVRAVAFSRDGRLAATGGFDSMVRLWRTAPRAFSGPMTHGKEVLAGAMSPDGKLAATASIDGTARLWYTATGQAAGPPLRHKDHVHGVVFSPDGRTLLTASADGTAQRWRVQTGAAVDPPLAHAAGLYEAVFSPDGQRIATASADQTAALWDAVTGQRQIILKHEAEVLTVAFHPSGRLLMIGCADGKARLWDSSTGALKATLPHDGLVWHCAFRPDGKKVVTASDDWMGRLWSVDDPGQEPVFLPHLQALRTAACSDDGKWIATGGHDRMARIWDAESGEPLTRPLEHQRPVLHVAFQPGGALLATGSVDRTARLWDTRLGRPVGPVLPHAGSVTAVVFNSTGSTLLTCAKDGNAWLWPVPTPMEGDAGKIIHWTERITGKTLDATGAVRFLDVPDWQERREENGANGP